ncbi:MAG: class I SAM-dependent methyltransferase [Ilumatobacteraceae bacterium]
MHDAHHDALRINRANWDSRVPFHEHGYRLDRYRTDPTLLSDTVRYDLPRLGSLNGLDVVHLQCHLGTDTLSLARLGARSVTGLDFSEPALEVARRLAVDCGADITYVAADVYDAVTALGAHRFDLVYTGIGALCWLPDIRAWARTVATLLRPGGQLFIREGHPVLWSLCDPRPDHLLVVEFPYFEVADGTRFAEPTTYVAHDGELASPETVQFNHGLAEIFNALWDAGLDITLFEEHRSVPWNATGWMVADDDGEYWLPDGKDRLPASYTLRATRRAEPAA